METPLSQAVRDFRGVPITVGANVVYPTRRGSAMQMISGVVEFIDTKPGNYTVLTISRRRESSTYAQGFADFSYLDGGRPVKVDVARVAVVS